MGEDLPNDPPGYDPTKWWCLHVINWIGLTPVGLRFCCKTGADLNAWIASHGDGNSIICPVGGIDYQTLVFVGGPWDDFGNCNVNCGP